MTVLFGDKTQLSINKLNAVPQRQRSHHRDLLQQSLQAVLQAAKGLSPDGCLKTIETNLLAMQRDCKAMQTPLIVIEEKITCGQYELGGGNQDTAILFRGSSADFAVAICVTAKGSLLHRTDYPWVIHCNVGDVDPLESISLTE